MKPALDFLVLDHYFQQDIEALRRGASTHRFWVEPYLTFFSLAHEYFPEAAFTSVDGFLRPEYADGRRQYESAARKRLHELYLLYGFDAIIVPSDTIFYFRPLADAGHEIGLPFIVLQKETTISPHTMIEHAHLVGRSVPFIGDLMLVCSERHKQFWLNAASDGDKIIVTGQPRFDLYRHPEQWRSWPQLGITLAAGRPVVLFLSYDLGAYSPEGEMTARTWWQLRGETEEVLISLAREGRCNLLIKPHPQQALEGEEERLAAMAGSAWGRTVWMVSPDKDARHLIVNAQVVVGFQTTALFEAMAAGKEVIYTFWSLPATRYAGTMIAFHEHPDLLRCVRSPQELREAVLMGLQSAGVDQSLQTARQAFIEEYLGPVDGRAAERAIRHIEAFVCRYAQNVDDAARTARKNLDARAAAHRRSLYPRANLAAALWRLAGLTLPVAYPVWRLLRRFRRHARGTSAPPYAAYRDLVAQRRQSAQQVVAACRASRWQP